MEFPFIKNLNEVTQRLKEKFRLGIKNIIKEDMQKADARPSLALEEDRLRYLRYCISILQEEGCSPMVQRAIPSRLVLANGLSNKDLTRLMCYFLTLRLKYSNEWVAHNFRVEVKIIEQFEEVCKLACKQAIEKRKLTGVAIVGTN